MPIDPNCVENRKLFGTFSYNHTCFAADILLHVWSLVGQFTDDSVSAATSLLLLIETWSGLQSHQQSTSSTCWTIRGGLVDAQTATIQWPLWVTTYRSSFESGLFNVSISKSPVTVKETKTHAINTKPEVKLLVWFDSVIVKLFIKDGTQIMQSWVGSRSKFRTKKMIVSIGQGDL